MKLNNNWQFIYNNKEYPATVPGTIHTDLKDNGLLEDPYYRQNEKKTQWVDKQDWTYINQFEISKEDLKKNKLLLFHGLDTYANVYLNDELVYFADNMFTPHNIDITKNLLEGTNKLQVTFLSPVLHDLPKIEETGFEYMAINDDSKMGDLGDNKVSIYARKAPYHYGWDWGPRIITSGFHKEVELLSFDEYVLHNVTYHNSFVDSELYLQVELDIYSNKTQEKEITVAIKGNKTYKKLLQLKTGRNTYKFEYKLDGIELWYPNGYGEQTRYLIETYIDDTLVDSFKKGFSKIEVIIEEDQWGESFYFRVNGQKVFAKGANHIPNSMYLTEIDRDHYYHEIMSAKEANYNMIRVWGGGVYESDDFYDLCDELGLIVWQDFMFACSMYPGDKKFLENVKEEALFQVNRLKKYASIGLFCGNNENDNAWGIFEEKAGWGWKERYTKEQQEQLTKAYLDLYHELLPEVVEENTNLFYWPSSPFTGHLGKHSTYSSKSGDMHYWDVWHGRKPFTASKNIFPRFMSEFGIQSFPSMKTINSFTEKEDLNIYSKTMELHQKSPIGNEVITHYIASLYKHPNTLENLIYLSQLAQAEGIKFGVEHMRRNINNTMGILYWQLNDCYPVASWSSIDYYGRWKALHYYAKRFFAPILGSMVLEDNNVEFHITNDSAQDTPISYTIKQYALDGTHIDIIHGTKIIPSMDNIKVFELDVEKELKDESFKEKHYYCLEVYSGDHLLSENNFFLDPFKYVLLEKEDVEIVISEEKEFFDISLKSKTFVKSIELDCMNHDVLFDDNYFDLHGNISKTIKVQKNRNDITLKKLQKELVLKSVVESF